MRPDTEAAVRATLRQHTDGLTLTQIAQHSGVEYRKVHRAIAKMPDTYIDRWCEPEGPVRYQAVWCAVVPPPNCPHPKD